MSGRCVAQVYDSVEQRWHPAQVVRGGWDRYLWIDLCLIQYCDSEQLGAAIVTASDSMDDLPDLAVLVVFGVQVPSVTLVPVQGVSAVRWLPGTTSLLVVGRQGLARVDADTAKLPAELRVQWTRVPELLQLGLMEHTCLRLVPGIDRALLMVSQTSRGAEPAKALLVLVSTSLLISLGCWCIKIKSRWDSEDPPHMTLTCGWSAVVVCVGEYSGCQVHASDRGRIGELLFVLRTPLRHFSFSSCYRFLAGIRDMSGVMVLDARTGDTMVRLERDHFQPQRAADITLEVYTRAWSASGQLHVATRVMDHSREDAGLEVLFAGVCFA